MRENIKELIERTGNEGKETLIRLLVEEEKLLAEGFSVLERAELEIRNFCSSLEQYLPPEPIRRVFCGKCASISISKSEKKKLLFVDDDRMWLSFLEEVGHILGYGVLSTDSPEHALEIVEREKPDLIITDLKMPQINGVKLLRELKRRKYSIPSLILTGYPSQKLIERAGKMNVKRVLTKPVRINDLKEAIQNIIGI